LELTKRELKQILELDEIVSELVERAQESEESNQGEEKETE